MSSRPAPSAALVAANQQLYQLRRQCAATQAAAHASAAADVPPLAPTAALPGAPQWPEHLGWHSWAVSQSLRPRERHSEPPFTPDRMLSGEIPAESLPNSAQTAQ
ncbi:MAG: hypothetical protein CSB13_01910, partial [Chloroflexi bacterium]